mmetsp:Transcript_857/g.2048  ORF Transcript_857/g.2048 Transcript_857/m.2048 type:complete len:513 (+) Transcript_857:4047-5585(+)
MADECWDLDRVDDKCAYVQDHCDSIMQVYFCDLGGTFLGLIPLGFFFAGLVYMLGHTAAEYFAPALADIAEKLNISPTLAGVTLLAFGNGAPDVFASILAGQKSQIFLGIGGLVGAGLFINTIVVAAILIAGGETQLHFLKFLRDSGTYLATVIVLMVYGLAGSVEFWMAALLPGLYGVYVIIVLYTEQTTKSDEIADLEMPVLQSHGTINWGSVIDDYVKTEVSTEAQTPRRSIPAHSFKQSMSWSLLRIKLSWDSSKLEFDSYTSSEKFFFVLTWPLNIVRRITIPYFNDDNWSRPVAAMTPFFATIFLLVTQDLFSVHLGSAPLWSLLIPVSTFVGIFIWFTSKRSKPPTYNFALTLAGFAMTIMWICTICSYIVDSLSLLGIELDLPNELLGMTLLAWGNSVGDFLANVSIAKIGLSETALTACYAGPLFNILVGLGVSLCLATLEGPVSFPLFSKPTIVVSLCFLLLSLSVSILVMTLRQGTMGQGLAKIQVGLYLAFTVTLAVVLA